MLDERDAIIAEYSELLANTRRRMLFLECEVGRLQIELAAEKQLSKIWEDCARIPFGEVMSEFMDWKFKEMSLKK